MAHRSRVALTAALLVVAGATTLVPAAAQQEALGEHYLDALIGLWEPDASMNDVETLMGLLAEDAAYMHPRAGVRIEGRARIGRAMAGFLGQTRSALLDNVEFVSGRGIEIVGFDLAMEARTDDGWQPVTRRQVIVLEVAEGRITAIRDYW